MGTSEKISRRYPKDIDLREIPMPPVLPLLRARHARGNDSGDYAATESL